jgi:uncharacterized protein YggT (Ycf19 family)
VVDTGSDEAQPDDATSPPAAEPIPPAREKRRNYRAAAVARVVVGVAVFVIGARFLGALIAPASPSFFLGVIDRLSGPLVAPFRGSFVDRGSSTHILEISSLVALVVVGLVGWGAVVLVRYLPARRGAVAPQGRLSRSQRVLPVVVKAMLGVVLVVIAVRAMLLGAGASAQSSFVNVVFHVGSALVAPFQSVFPDGGTATNTIEFASLLAIFVYALIGLAVVQVFRVLATPPGTKPVTIKQAKSPFDGTLAALAGLSYAVALFVVVQQYTPISVPVASDSVSASDTGVGSLGGNTGTSGSGTSGNSSGGSGQSVTATAVAAPHAFCAVSLVTSQNGVSWYRRVNTTTSDPCYSHWTVRTSSGPDCGMYYNGGQYVAPPNLWNISQWGQDQYYVYVAFSDGRAVILRCVIDLGNYPQTTLYRTDWG